MNIVKTSINKIQETLLNVGIADQQKAGKQGRDDSIKQLSTQPHITHLSTLEDV